MTERIEVRVRSVRGSPGGGHLFIVYYPEKGPPQAISLSPFGSTGMLGGDSRLNEGAWNAEHYDWPRQNETPSRLIKTFEDTNLSSVWNGILRAYRDIATDNNYYFPWKNSNSAASKALGAVGIRVPWEDSGYYVPGIDWYRYRRSGVDTFRGTDRAPRVDPANPNNLLDSETPLLANSGTPQTFQRDYQPYFRPGQFQPGPVGQVEMPRGSLRAPDDLLQPGFTTVDPNSPPRFRRDYKPYFPAEQLERGFAIVSGSHSGSRPSRAAEFLGSMPPAAAGPVFDAFGQPTNIPAVKSLAPATPTSPAPTSNPLFSPELGGQLYPPQIKSMDPVLMIPAPMMDQSWTTMGFTPSALQPQAWQSPLLPMSLVPTGLDAFEQPPASAAATVELPVGSLLGQIGMRDF